MTLKTITATGTPRAICIAFGIAAIMFLILAPAFLNLYWVRILTYVFMFATLAQGINIIAGYAGYPAFGNVVFFGLGGYSTAIVMARYQGTLLTGIAVAIVVCIVFSLVFAPPLLRLRGHYFAIATLGLNEATRSVVNNLTEFTGGGMGLSLPLPPGKVEFNAALFYYLFFAVMAFSVLVIFLLSRSRIGYAWRAIRDNEEKAEAMGIRTTLHKMLAWMVSGVLTGIAGAINAYWLSYIEPPSAFDMTIAVKSFVMYLLGGAGTVLGPVIGAFFIELLFTVTWSNLLEFHVGAMGLIIMIVVIFLPNGFLEFLREIRLNARVAKQRDDG